MQEQRSANAWRKQSSGPVAWGDRLISGGKNKYFMVSADAHANEPLDLFSSRIKAPEYQDRLPRVITDAEGVQWLHTDGWPPQRVRIPADRKDLLPQMESFENYEVLAPYAERMEDEDVLRSASARTLDQRLRDNALDGVDAEVVFPQKGILGFATPDPVFAGLMTRAWNRWALETFKAEFHRVMPMALIAAGDLENAIKEVRWAAENGFHGVMISNRAIFSRLDQPKNRLEYNDPMFEPLWATIQETGLPLVFHVGNGEDPRAAHGRGAAIVAFQTTMYTAIDPVVTLISSGVLERFPNLKVGVIEAGASWIPWVLGSMDHAYRAHHMWVRPVIPELPSFYFKRNCFASTLEDMADFEHLCELGFEDNLLWSSDYPHHEGSFPYSKLSIERQMGQLTDAQRTKILGANAVRVFNIDAAKVRASQAASG